MRILVRPTRAKAGRANVVGYAFAALHTSRSQVGVLLDAWGQHARCTVREISTFPQPVRGVPRGRVEETLRLVALAPAVRADGSPEPAVRGSDHYLLGIHAPAAAHQAPRWLPRVVRVGAAVDRVQLRAVPALPTARSQRSSGSSGSQRTEMARCAGRPGLVARVARGSEVNLMRRGGPARCVRGTRVGRTHVDDV